MTKTLLILVTLLLAACGGAPFDGEAAATLGAGGDDALAGAPDVSGGGSDVSPAGTGGGAGKATGGTAGAAGGHPATGGAGASSGGGGSGGSTPVTCEFDVTQLTAALPTTITWNDFTYTDGALCVTCRDKPCGTIHVISWGVPQLLEDGRYQYLPNAEMPMIAMNLGTNDGACTKAAVCGIKMAVSSLRVTVAKQGSSWAIGKAEVDPGAVGNQCTEGAGLSSPYPAAADLKAEIEGSLSGLKIPCN